MKRTRSHEKIIEIRGMCCACCQVKAEKVLNSEWRSAYESRQGKSHPYAENGERTA
jgi:hypothetical protein